MTPVPYSDEEKAAERAHAASGAGLTTRACELAPGDWIERPGDGKPDRVMAKPSTNVVTDVTTLYLKFAGNTQYGADLPVRLTEMHEVESEAR